MIRIQIDAGQNLQARVDELFAAVTQKARVWRISDRRRKRYLEMTHAARNVRGTVRRVDLKDEDHLSFECHARDQVQEAITAGRFVHLVLRHSPTATTILVERRK